MDDLSDDQTLVAALRAGDEQAFAWLVQRFDASLRRTARTFVPSQAVADEVVQETWLGVIRGLDRFEGRSSLKTWIFQILINTARTRGVREHRSIPFSSFFAGDGDARGGAAGDGPRYEGAFPESRFRGPDDPWPGHWATPPTPWQPDEQFDRKATLELVREAIQHLPPAQRTVLSLRDIDGWTSVEVCALLEISAANQRVLLHRARAAVRAHLEPSRTEVVA